jgi:hypothetical protein
LTVGVHELLELSGILDLEEDFLAILSREYCTWLLTLRLSCSGAAAAGAVVISLTQKMNIIKK